MKFAINLPLMGPLADPHTALDLAVAAENAGWEGFFVWDHISYWGMPAADPWTTLGAVAVKTRALRLGVMITPLARRRPSKVARETVTLDHLSGGRMVFGVGLGGGGDEWRELGDDYNDRTRAAMTDEALEVITGLWRGEPLTYRGQHHTTDGNLFLPTPVQQPRIPVWVGGLWPNKAPFRRAAKWDGVYPIGRDTGLSQTLTASDLADVKAYVTSQRESDAPFDLIHGGMSPAGSAKAQTIVAPFAAVGVTWWLEQIHPWAFGWDWRDPEASKQPWPFEAMRQRVLAGPPKL